MKITFVCDRVSVAGGPRVIARHARNLLSYGHDVTVVSRRRSVPQILKYHAYRLLGRPMKPEKPNQTLYFESLGRRHRMYAGPIRADQVPDGDVVIATFWSTAEAVAALPPEKGAKAYFVQHHEVHPHLPVDRVKATYHLPMKKVVVSKWLADIMENVYGDSDTVTVPNAIDLDHFNAPPRDRQAAPTLGFMYAGTAFKGAGTALDVIETLRRRFPDLEVVAFGMSDPLDRLPLPPGTRYRKLPAQEDIPGLYAACDVWLVPSRAEGFGLPLLEAMACRTPVVSTRTGAAEDLIEDDVNGYVVDVGDTDALADRASRILALPNAEWRAVSDAAYARAHTWTWDTASRAFEAALEDIVAARATVP